MSVIIAKNKLYLLVAFLLLSCNNYYNLKKIKSISDLQSQTSRDHNLLNLLPILDLNNTLKIAKLNLSKIEEKKLDSIAIELIYFEYKEYLNCVNIVYEGMQEINNLSKELSTNMQQLESIKSDYKNSRSNRDDLNPHLIKETEIVHTTSIKVKKLVQELELQVLQFDTLNAKIESLISL